MFLIFFQWQVFFVQFLQSRCIHELVFIPCNPSFENPSVQKSKDDKYLLNLDVLGQYGSVGQGNFVQKLLCHKTSRGVRVAHNQMPYDVFTAQGHFEV